MDSLLYISLMAIHILILILLIFTYPRSKFKKLYPIISGVQLAYSLFLYIRYLYDSFFATEFFSGYVVVTDIMRIFMLDDHYNLINRKIGVITSTIYLSFNIFFFALFLIKFLKSSKQRKDNR